MIKYKKKRKYKYILDKDYPYDTKIAVDREYKSRHLEIDTKGHLLIKSGYAWDGATCFPDLETIMRGSLVHDALYQLIREGILKQSDRDAADRIIEDICEEAGMFRWLAHTVYKAVKIFGQGRAENDSRSAP